MAVVPGTIPDAKGASRTARRDERRRRKVRYNKREAIGFYLFLSPWLIGFVAFLLGPIIASLLLSFTNWNMLNTPQWVGLTNYINLLTQTPQFWQVLGNTAFYAFILVPLGIVVSLVLAVLLNQQIFIRRFFRTVFYLPATIPVVAIAMLWSWVLAPAGILNEVLKVFGINGPAWLINPVWIKPSLILVGLWSVGASVVLFLAALQGVPRYLYEASALEGASPFRQFLRITVPMISPIILFNLVNGIIGSLQVFSQTLILTDGAPSGLMLIPYLYNQAFQFFELGFASALAWVFFIMIIILTLIILRWSRAWVYYESEVR